MEFALWKQQLQASANDTISPEQLAQLKENYERALTAYRAGKISEMALLEQERPYRIAQILAGKLREEVMAEKTGLKAAEARYAKALYYKRNRVVTAPFTGIIGDIQVSPGSFLRENQVMMKIVDLKRIKVKLEVLENHIYAVQPGTTVEIRFPAWPDTVFEGQIVGVDPTIDEKSRTVQVIALLKNSGGQIKAGMMCESRIVTHQFRNRLLVPRDAVVTRDQRKLVFIVRNGKAVWCYVKTGMENEDYIEIVQSDFNLKPGEPVIVDGQFALAHNAPVDVQSNP